jgi:hypothetical protein
MAKKGDWQASDPVIISTVPPVLARFIPDQHFYLVK